MLAFELILAGVLGALIGSFGNVVIWRVPRGESIVKPRSRCPNCGHELTPLELVPILSWLVLRGRCRVCRQPISARYPAVEFLMAALFVLLVSRWPVSVAGPAVLPLLAVVAMLVMAALIDVDHFILPDSLTFPALFVALAGSFLWGSDGLPAPSAALVGALVGAGVLVLINRLGALVLRRFSDTRERLFPVSLDQANLGALFGALGGVWLGLGAGVVNVLVNALTKRVVRLPEQLIYGLWVVALILTTTTFTVPTGVGLTGSVMAAGAWALLGALYWWVHDMVEPEEPELVRDAEAEAAEPVAMGFGDVKLAAVLGAFLGWEKFLVGLFLAVSIGALFGIIQRLLRGSRLIPFGPYLLVGALAALFFGDGFIQWYFGLLGVG